MELTFQLKKIHNFKKNGVLRASAPQLRGSIVRPNLKATSKSG